MTFGIGPRAQALFQVLDAIWSQGDRVAEVSGETF